jgi:hypothetical protein
MIGKSDWDAAHESVLQEGRERLGPPPTAEELNAYAAGELSAEETARVQELLAYYPDVARTLLAEDLLSEEELAHDWKSLIARTRAAETQRRVRIWQTIAAVAAVLAIVMSALFAQTKSNERRLTTMLSQPRVVPEVVLRPEGMRGGDSTATAVSTETEVILNVSLFNADEYAEFRMDIVDEAKHVVWSGKAERNEPEDALNILLPQLFVREAKYQVVLYGLSRGQPKLLQTYTFQTSSH